MFLYLLGRGALLVIALLRGLDGTNPGRWSNNANRLDRGHGGAIESGACEKRNTAPRNTGAHAALGQ